MQATGAGLPSSGSTTPEQAARKGGSNMKNHRFGRTLKLPSTLAIKHQILTMMLEDEVKAIPTGAAFDPSKSPALASLKRLQPNRMT
jgi:hypothetical protein